MYGTTPKRLASLIIITLICFPILISLFFRAESGIDYAAGMFAQYRRDQQGLKMIAASEKFYREDTYGGKTPEETMQLFTSALKNGDVELASRYFVLGEQVKQKEYFEKVKQLGRLSEAISDFSNGIKFKGSLYENNKQYEIVDNKGHVIFGLVDFVRYPSNIWKLTEL